MAHYRVVFRDKNTIAMIRARITRPRERKSGVSDSSWNLSIDKKIFKNIKKFDYKKKKSAAFLFVTFSRTRRERCKTRTTIIKEFTPFRCETALFVCPFTFIRHRHVRLRSDVFDKFRIVYQTHL